MDLSKLTNEKLLFLERFYYEQVMQIRTLIINLYPTWYNTELLKLTYHLCVSSAYKPYTCPPHEFLSFFEEYKIPSAEMLVESFIKSQEKFYEYEPHITLDKRILDLLKLLRSIVYLQKEIYSEIIKRNIPIPDNPSLVENTFSEIVVYCTKYGTDGYMCYDFMQNLFNDSVPYDSRADAIEYFRRSRYLLDDLPREKLDFIQECFRQNMHIDYIYELNPPIQLNQPISIHPRINPFENEKDGVVLAGRKIGDIMDIRRPNTLLG